MNSALLRVAHIPQLLHRLQGDGSDWLSISEQARLARLKPQPRRNQYLAGHWLLRLLLAECAGGSPRDWMLDERLNQPPTPQRADVPRFLSLSHSADWIAAAVSPMPIGIDLEARHPEREALQSFRHLLIAHDDVADALSNDDLLLRWVLKEAWIKRDHGSALPDQLARISLRRASDAGQLRACSTSALHLAVCSDAHCHIDLPEAILSQSHWNAESIPPS